MGAGSGGLDNPFGIGFGADGNLYVNSFSNDEIIRYNGETGAFVDVFVSEEAMGLDAPEGLIFGPDGNLYVSSSSGDEVLRYNGETGDFIDAFVTAESGGLDGPTGISFFEIQRTDGGSGCTIVSGNKQTSTPLYLILLFSPAIIFIRKIFRTKKN